MMKNFSSDPLGGSKDPEWDSFFQDNKIKKLIVIDIDRTFQEKDLFRNQAIKEMLVINLFMWSKENKSVGYWQGMNDIMGLILLAIHPFYFSANVLAQKNKSLSNSKNFYTKFINQQESKKNNDLDYKQIYLYFHDLDELAADVYFLYSLFMSNGFTDIFNKTPVKEISDKTHKQRIEKSVLLMTGKSIKNSTDIIEKKQDMLKVRTESMVNIYLKNFSSELYNHFKKVDFDFHIIMLKWYKCIFSREFHPSDCIQIIDTIIFVDYLNTIESIKSNNIDNNVSYAKFFEFIGCAMIFYLKDDLLTKDCGDMCYARLHKFPPIESVNIIINLGFKIMNAYEKKLKMDEEKTIKPKVSPKTNSNENNKNENSISVIEKKNSNSNIDNEKNVNQNICKLNDKNYLEYIVNKYKNTLDLNEIKRLTEIIGNFK